MAKRAAPVRSKSADEIKAEVVGALDALFALNAAYEAGRTGVVFSMATEVVKIISDGPGAIRSRAHRSFKTVLDPPLDAEAQHKLVCLQFSPEGFGCAALPLDYDPIELDWKEWWNKDRIYVASDLAPGPGGILLAGTTPEAQRRRWTRREFVQEIRNKFGAHITPDVPEELSALSEADALFAVALPDLAGSPPIKPHPPLAAAMMHRIALEVLAAYGVD